MWVFKVDKDNVLTGDRPLLYTYKFVQFPFKITSDEPLEINMLVVSLFNNKSIFDRTFSAFISIGWVISLLFDNDPYPFNWIIFNSE